MCRQTGSAIKSLTMRSGACTHPFSRTCQLGLARRRWTCLLPRRTYSFPNFFQGFWTHEQRESMLSAAHGHRGCFMRFPLSLSFQEWCREFWRSGRKSSFLHLIGPGGLDSLTSRYCQWPHHGVAQPGGAGSPGHAVAPADHLAFERCALSQDNFSRVIRSIQASRPFMERIYSATLQAFCNWCDRVGVFPLQALIAQILEFLLDGLDSGLACNPIRRQVAVLSTVLTCGSLTSLSQHPTIQRFLRGATNLCPSVVHRYPTWDLPILLDSLTGALYEPLRTTSLRHDM